MNTAKAATATETTMGAAFDRAGRKSPIRTAEQAADEAVRDSGGDYEEAKLLFRAAPATPWFGWAVRQAPAGRSGLSGALGA